MLLGLAAGCTHTVERHDSVWEARRLLESGRNEEAMLLLQGVVVSGREAEKVQEATYLLGLAYYRMGAHAKAGELLQEYLENYNGGAYKDGAVEILRAINEKAAVDQQRKAAAAEAFSLRLQAAETAVKSNPNSANARTELGDVYYSAGRYEEAIQAYGAAERLGFDTAADPGVADRLGDARFQVAREGTERALAGLVVSDVSHDVRHEPRGGGYRNYVVVTGKVTNSTAEAFRSVTVNVSVYSTLLQLVDARDAGVGTLRPGQIKAFSVRIEDIGNVPIVDVVCRVYAD